MVFEKEFSDDEAQLYDRQIRLWGVEAQKKLRKCDLLLVGLSSLGSEIVKNLVLCGINSITIIDSQDVTPYESLGHLFTESKIGQNRGEAAKNSIESLNPRVKIDVHDWDISKEIDEKSERLESIIKRVHVICATNQSSEILIKLNNLGRSLNDTIKFYAANNWGFYGFAFNDLGKGFKYIVEEKTQTADVDICEEPLAKKIKKDPSGELHAYVEKSLDYISLENALAVKSGKSNSGGITKRASIVLFMTHTIFKFYSKNNRFPSTEHKTEDMAALQELQAVVIEKLGMDDSILDKLRAEGWWENIFGELSPICAVLGGIIGQDILRTISAQDTPIKNFIFFNGIKCSAFIENLGS